MGSNLERMLTRLQAGEVGFGQFIEGTRGSYRAMAVYLMRRWRTPEWLTREDVEQELYLETWRIVPKYDRARGSSISRYVVFNAMWRTKRRMHAARGVSLNGNPDKKPSAFEQPITHLEHGAEGSRLLDSLIEEAHAEVELAEREEVRKAATRALAVCTTKAERYVVLAIREAGSVDGAARVLHDDIDHRIACRLGSEDKAERFVLRHAARVAERLHEAGVNPG